MSDAIIRDALEVVAKSWAAARDLAVAWENTVFTPPEGAYAKTLLMPADTQRLFLDETGKSLKGLFQVTLHMVLGTQVWEAEEHLVALETALGTRITRAGVVIYLSPLSRHTAYPSANRWILPASLSYRVEAA